MELVTKLDDIKHTITNQPLVLLLIKAEQCGVCDSVFAKLEDMLPHFADVVGKSIYIEAAPEVASEYLVLAAPTLLLFFEGREVYRVSRFVRFEELQHVLTQYSEALRDEG